jgi:short-subunit dehydrogenase
MAAQDRAPLALITGASSGIGFELAQICHEEGMRLVIAANEPEIDDAQARLAASGGESVRALNTDLSTIEGVDATLASVMRTEGDIDYLFANAGLGPGHAFVEQDVDDIMKEIETNITGAVYLLHRVAGAMVARRQGRILITRSIAGVLPGSFSAVSNGTKAFLDNFAIGLRNELKDTGVTVTCLMPGPSDTRFFERADLLDTKAGQDEKDSPADLARTAFEALMRGEAGVVHGAGAKLQAALANVLPKTMSADGAAILAQPGSAKEQ